MLPWRWGPGREGEEKGRGVLMKAEERGGLIRQRPSRGGLRRGGGARWRLGAGLHEREGEGVDASA